MTTEKELQNFKDSGMLWFVNTILHTFGWAIVIEYEGKQATRMYPTRTKLRGFTEQANTKGYINVSKYMKEHADELYLDVSE